MWFEQFELKYKKSKLNIKIPLGYYSQPCTKEEFNAYYECTGDYETDYKKVSVPNYLRLTNELKELLKISNGGVLCNKQREFRFFDMETIRYFYVYYGFIVHHSNYLPIAFSEELYFYLYKFENNTENPKIYTISLYDIGNENEIYFIGNSLEEIMLKTYSLEDEIYEYQKIKVPKLSEKEQQKENLQNQLEEITNNRQLGKLSLKEYLKSKKIIENKLKHYT